MANWYKWYPGDFLRDTQDLTLEENGAYRILIDHYMMTERPIPGDIHRIRRLFGGISLQKTRKIWAVLCEFFDEKNGSFYHKKCEKMLANIMKEKENKSKAAYARWHAESMLPDTRYQIPEKKEKVKKEKKPTNGNGSHQRFEEFWSIYPRKIGKKAAEQKFLKLSETDQKLAIADCRTRKWNPDPQYILHPTTYINQARWNDEPDPEPVTSEDYDPYANFSQH